jgi:hypothetical protein
VVVLQLSASGVAAVLWVLVVAAAGFAALGLGVFAARLGVTPIARVAAIAPVAANTRNASRRRRDRIPKMVCRT